MANLPIMQIRSLRTLLRAFAVIALLAPCAGHAADPGGSLVPSPLGPRTNTPIPADKLIVMASPNWTIRISPLTGGVVGILDPRDDHRMNWVHEQRPWGIVFCALQGNKIVFNHPTSVTQVTDRSCDVTYKSMGLKLTVHRVINDQNSFTEAYRLTNLTGAPCSLPTGSVSIAVPFNDSYTSGAPACLTNNCNTHLWAGGNSSWVNAIRMGGEGPHLGLVLTQGSLASYSILDGPSSNDRGYLAFNPSSIDLRPGESSQLSWDLFWHQGWNDFWAHLQRQSSFIRMQAAHYTVVQGQSIDLTAESASPLSGAQLTLNGAAVPFRVVGNKLTASVKVDHLGEYLFDLENNGLHTWLKANAITHPKSLVEARVKFIVEKQQKNAPGDPLDGAYLPYDNQLNQQEISRVSDHNEGRERIGMGVLVALYIPLCGDPGLKRELLASLQKYEAFLQRELMDPSGIVYDEAHYAGDSSRHGYNYPWMAHMHLAAYKATGDRKYLQLYFKVCQALYNQRNGASYYEIGLPILDGLDALNRTSMHAEREELLKDFTRHADNIAARGGNYSKSEVDYEQSIVGPGVQTELEMYLVTKNPAYLNSARQQLVYLDAFNGQQPDYHLHDIAIRHWDDFWFGKLRLYGDTFPHYWSTITGVAFDVYATATGDESYRARAWDIFLGNACLFTPEGRASCAYVYPATVNGIPGNRFDPLANDQDWALVNWLTVSNRIRIP